MPSPSSNTMDLSISAEINDSMTLPRLVPADIVPVMQPQMPSPNPVDMAAATMLARVLAVSVQDIVDGNGKTQYEVHTVLQSTRNRIPVAVVPGRATVLTSTKPDREDLDNTTSLGKPDVVAVVRFGAFRELRDAVYNAAQNGHDPGQGVMRSCTFCSSVVDAVLLDQMQPHRYDEWIRSSSTLCTRLEAFLVDLLVRARGDDTTSRPTTRRAAQSVRPRCAVQAHVQALIVQFLQLPQPTSTS